MPKDEEQEQIEDGGGYLCEFMAFLGRWSTGTDGISDAVIKIPPEEKYNAFPLTDGPGQMYRFIVYAPLGSKDPSGAVRKKAIERVTQGLPLRGRMGNGQGADNDNTQQKGHHEDGAVGRGTVVSPPRGRTS